MYFFDRIIYAKRRKNELTKTSLYFSKPPIILAVFLCEKIMQQSVKSARSKKDQSCSKAPDITGFCGTHAGAQKEVDLVRGRGGVTIAF